MRGDRAGESASLQVVDGAGRVLELGPIELRGGKENAGKVLRLLAALDLSRAGLDPGHLDAHVAGELLDRFGKGLAAELHQEADRGAVGPAAEAVIELLGLAYREGGGLLTVERTAGDEVGAGLLERNEPVDDVDDVDAGQQRLYEIVWNHRLDAAHPPRPLPEAASRAAPLARPPGRVTRQGILWIIGNLRRTERRQIPGQRNGGFRAAGRLPASDRRASP